jgi:hypothetical protein
MKGFQLAGFLGVGTALPLDPVELLFDSFANQPDCRI